MTGRGVGRGRGKAQQQQPQEQLSSGRGRGKAQQQPQEQLSSGGPAWSSYAQMGGGSTAPPQPRPAQPPAPSAWGPPPGASARATHRAPSAQPGDVTSQMGQMSLGRAPQPQACAPSSGGQPAPPTSGNGNGNGNGNGAGAPVGRGAMRGKRPVENAIIRTRPSHLATKQGRGGTRMNFTANYFELKTVPSWALHQYRVDIAPEEDRTGERRYLLRVHREKLGGYLFDGTVLYTTNRITSPQNPVLTLTSQGRNTEEIFTLTVKEVGEVQRGDYAYVQVYNLLLRTCLGALKLQLVGRDYYDAAAKVEIPAHRLELWPGYKTSIRQHENSILMCVEVTHKVMRMETVLDILRESYNRDRSNYQRIFIKEVVGCIVLTKYNNKTYRIDDVSFDIHPTNTFMYKNEEISYAEYMSRKYQITIRDLKQPMLVSRAKARDVRAGMSEVVNLIPEVCYCTGLTDDMRANFRLMSALAEHTRVGPDVRINKLLNFNRRLQSNQEAMDQFKKFEMKLAQDLVQIPGRQVEDEFVLYGNNIKNKVQNADWSNDFKRNFALLHAKELKNWNVIVPSKFQRDANAFIGMLQRACQGMRMNISQPNIIEVGRGNAIEYVNTLTQVLDQSQPQIIMCVVPGKVADTYSAIKKKCCVDRAVPTQVITGRNLNDPKKSMTIATKVAIQMNCKIGGAPWTVELPMGGLMVVGFDVCHDTNSKSKSYGAMVASLDKSCSRYFSAVTPHSSGEELSKNLALNIVKAVRKYAQVNGAPPTKIIVYRDGVGEGQIPFVLSTELESIKEMLAQVYAGSPLQMAFIIVTKRINTRVFTDRRQNPPPGAVIDDIITDPEKYDFFLVSQYVRQGSVSPTSFNVVYDTIMLPPERLQRLTYKMCHLYFNWSGTVRVPAPCQYAHKLAELVGMSLHLDPSQKLEDLLYFL